MIGDTLALQAQRSGERVGACRAATGRVRGLAQRDTNWKTACCSLLLLTSLSIPETALCIRKWAFGAIFGSLAPHPPIASQWVRPASACAPALGTQKGPLDLFAGFAVASRPSPR